MASTDWTLITDGVNGLSSIIDDSAGGGPSTTSLYTLGAITYQNITGGTILNPQVDCYLKVFSGNSHAEVALRSQDVLWDTGDKYTIMMQENGGSFETFVRRWNAGVSTLLVQTLLLPEIGSNTTWQRMRFSAITSGSNVLLRLEMWNGSAFVTKLDVTDSSSSRILAAGRVRIGSSVNDPTTNDNYWDSVLIYSLA